MSIESRLQALEKRAAQALPVYIVTFENGTNGYRFDALGLLLHLSAVEAGSEDAEAITDARCISGTLPAGSAWDSLRDELQQIRQKGGTNEKAII